jgi:hypothetical protein
MLAGRLVQNHPPLFSKSAAVAIQWGLAESMQHPLDPLLTRLTSFACRSRTSAHVYDHLGLRGAGTPLSIHLRSRLRFLSSDSQYISAPLYENLTSALDWRFITSTLWPTLLYSLQQLLIPSRKNDALAWTISTPLVCLWYFRRDMVSSNTCSRRIPRVGSLRKPPDRGVDDGQSS